MNVLDHEGAIDDLAPVWDRLLDPAARLGPFPTSLWSRLWWDHFGRDEAAAGGLRIATVPAGESLAAIVPLYREASDGPLLFLGGRDVTDYTVPAGPDLGAAAEAAIEVAAGEATALVCVSAPDDLAFGDALEQAAAGHGLPVTREPTEPAPYLDLPDDPEVWIEGLDAKERHELRRKLRRFHRELGEARVRRATPDTLTTDLELFFGWHRQAPGDKGTFMTPPREAFFRALAAELSARGWLALDILEGGGTPLAAGFSFVIGDTVYLYNSSLASDAVRWSPGMALVHGLVDRAIADGLSRLDFLKGSERYKYQLGGVDRTLSSITVGAVR